MDDNRRKNGSFWLGVGLIGCGIADAAVNPFAFMSAPELIGSGIAMIAISTGGKPKGDKGGYEGDYDVKGPV